MADDVQTSRDSRPEDEKITWDELLYCGEYCAWCALMLVPLVWWFNGPSVSTDQFYVRSCLLLISAVTAVGLRLGKWWVRRHKRRSAHDTSSRADGSVTS